MNILLLSNGAPNYHYFFNNLAQNFHADGANIVVAVDCKLSRDINGLDTLGFDVYEFSSYFSEHQTNNALLEKYADRNLNAALLSDFERADVYAIWGTKDHDYFERLKSALLSYFENIFHRHGIDVVLYENVSNTFAHFAYFVAEMHGACYCGIGGSRLPGRFSITADPLNDNEPSEIFRAIRSGEREVPPALHAWCEEYLANIETIVPDYMKINGLDNTSLLRRYIRRDRIKTIITLARHAADDTRHAFQVGNPVWHYFSLFNRNIARKIKTKWLVNYYDTPADGEKYLLYPLHFHPESSTSILAGTYLNEYEVIRNITFNLPEGVKLYVKDHISAFGYPSLEFYRRLKRLPNIRIIAPNAPTKALIRQSVGVITLTSTVGYEALLMGKKVFLYGSVFYKFHRNVITISDPTKIFNLLRSNIHDHDAPDRKKYNIDFVAAYFLSTKQGTLNLLQKGEAAKAMADSVYNLIVDHIVSSRYIKNYPAKLHRPTRTSIEAL